jgi:sulfite reductase beta subunit-like hemoprotein
MQVLQQRTAAPSRQGLHVCNVAVPSKPPAFKAPRRSKVEIIKEKSDYLRHPLMEELVNDNPHINDDAMQLMKFHGSYMQVCSVLPNRHVWQDQQAVHLSAAAGCGSCSNR